MKLTGHGIAAGLPRGWEGAIVRQSPVNLAGSRFYSMREEGEPADGALAGATVLESLPVVHLANFPLPADRGDFGSGAVDVMAASDVFVSLLEYGPENVGTPLFSRAGIPTALHTDQFHPLSLQRTLPGQAGYQEFFTTGGRAFCLYVVLGNRMNARALVAAVNTVLSSIEIGPRL